VARQQFVYLFRVGSVYKIGLSVSPSQRLAGLVAKGTDAECVHHFPSAGARKVERALHLRFVSKRIGGEWFALTADDVALIRTVLQADTPGDLPDQLQPTESCLPRGGMGREQAREAGIRVRTGVPLHVYVPPELRAAMEAHIDSAEPAITKTAYIEALIKADLRKQGRWPVQPRAEG
jgi:hypothetical protein